MTAKTARVYTPEELKEKSRQALADPNLAEEFERLVAQKKQSNPEVKLVTEKKFTEIEFELPDLGNFMGTEIIYRDRGRFESPRSIRFFITHHSPPAESEARHAGREFCMKILNALVETADPPGDFNLMNSLIRLFEEKIGLKIKTCGNCRYSSRLFQGYSASRSRCYPEGIGGCADYVYISVTPDEKFEVINRRENPEHISRYDICPHWALKEVSTPEKKEN